MKQEIDGVVVEVENPTVEESLACLDDRLHEVALSLASSDMEANIASSIDTLAAGTRAVAVSLEEEVGGALHRVADTNESISESLDRVADGLRAIAKAIENRESRG